MKPGWGILVAGALVACGGDPPIFGEPGSTGSGGASDGGSGAGASGAAGTGGEATGGGGEGGATECVPESNASCYGGPAMTAGVGICMAGVATCNRDGTGYGPCVGEVLPGTDDCMTGEDEDCDGIPTPCSTGTHLWSKAFGVAGSQVVKAVGIDAASDIVFGGVYDIGIDFGLGHTLPGVQNGDCFMVKLEDDGSFVWSQAFTGSQSTRTIEDLAVNGAGNILVVGMFQNTLNIGTASLDSNNGSIDAYLARLDASGQHVWSQKYGDSDYQFASRVAFAPNGDIVVGGGFVGTIAFSGLPALTSTGNADAFVVRLTGTGTPLWAHHISGGGNQNITALDVDSTGAVIVGGVFDTAIDLGGGSLIAAGSSDAFVAKLNAAGAYVFGKAFGNTALQLLDGVAVDANGNVILSLFASGAVDFGGGAIGSSSVVVVKLDGAGNHVASTAFGSGISQAQIRVAVDAFNNIVLLGEYADGSVNFGGGALPTFGNYDVLIAKLTPSLGHLWSIGFGSFYSEATPALAVDVGGHVVVGGAFQGTVTIGPNTFSPDGFDAFVARYSP